MTLPWDGTYPGAGREIPRTPRLRGDDLPPTFRTVDGHEGSQHFLFDPSTLHYPNAYRASDPSFPSPAREQAWRAARHQALHHVLASIAHSPWPMDWCCAAAWPCRSGSPEPPANPAIWILW